VCGGLTRMAVALAEASVIRRLESTS